MSAYGTKQTFINDCYRPKTDVQHRSFASDKSVADENLLGCSVRQHHVLATEVGMIGHSSLLYLLMLSIAKHLSYR